MKLMQLVAATAISAASVSAVATPIYYGDTDAANINGNHMTTGYYIWNDEDDVDSWHIRWSSTNAVAGNLVGWFGSIVLEGNGIESSSEFRFENGGVHGDTMDVDTGLFTDEIEWVAYTNDNGGIDGIDFTIADSVDILEFNLGSSLFDGLGEVSSGQGVAGTNIYVGDTLGIPNVYVFESNIGTYQSFEIDVPEPASLGLFGLGLAGLGVTRRRAAKA